MDEKQQPLNRGRMPMPEPMFEPTPREEMLAEAAEKAKAVKPQRYDITSNNAHAARVVHDYGGKVITIPPGETKQGISLRPDIAAYLGKTDLKVTPAKPPSAA